MSAHKVLFDIFRASEVPDPGDAETLTVDRSPMVVPLVSAGAETRTLARPNRMGAIVTLFMKTDGGDITLTVTGGYNEDGDTTFTFDDPGEFAMFVACYDGTNYFWRLFASHATGVLTQTEAGYLEDVTAGTAAASKALVLGTTKNIDSFRMTGKLFTPQAAPETSTDTATLTSAQMLSGILVATPTGAAAYTTLTGALLEDAVVAIHPSLTAGDCFDLTIINIGGTGDDITLTAAASGITIVGDAVVRPSADSGTEQAGQGTFRFRYTAADTFIVYRVS
jgi:hypothetical protein